MNDLPLPLWVLVLIPLALGLAPFLYATFGRWLEHKEKLRTAISEQTVEKAAQYAAHTERLEQRVRVLERIVTDKGIVVADQIEQLRNEPLN